MLYQLDTAYRLVRAYTRTTRIHNLGVLALAHNSQDFCSVLLDMRGCPGAHKLLQRYLDGLCF